MRVMITGGAGFIGRALARRLVAGGHDAAVVDVSASPSPLTDEIVGDLRRPEVREEAFAWRPDAVAHLAAVTSVLRSVDAPQETYDTNVAVTQALLDGCRTRGVRTFVFASTNAAVGSWDGDSPMGEGAALRPLTPYGATKAAGEMLCSAYRHAYGLATTSLRLTNVYGPGVWVKDSIVARLFRAAGSDGVVQIYGDGSQRRDYVYIDDVVDAFARGLAGELPPALIVGSGRSVTVKEIHRLACDASGREIRVEHVAARPGEMRAVMIDRSAAAKLGLPDPVPLEAGLRATWLAWPERAGPA